MSETLIIVDGELDIIVFDPICDIRHQILNLLAQHNEDVNNIINDFDILGDDDWRERIQFLQFQLINKIKALDNEDFVPANPCIIEFPLTTKQA